MKIKTLLCACITFSFSCGVISHSKTDEAAWLIGTWQNKTAQGSIYETWEKVTNTSLSGKSYGLKDRDTIIFETISIARRNNILTYTPTVNGQNNNEPVNFPLIMKTENKLVFENKTHDYPQMISYTRISKDSLIAEISGTKKGVEKRQAFPMKRVK